MPRSLDMLAFALLVFLGVRSDQLPGQEVAAAAADVAASLTAEAPASLIVPTDENSPAEGIRLDEAVTPIASFFQPSAASSQAKPKFPAINVSGAAQIDGVWFSQNDANMAVVGDAQDVADFRRSRLGANGNLAENVAYRMEYDFSFPGRPNFTDVWVDVADFWALGHLRVGQWKQPFSMEPATSFREIVFMERSLAFALVPFRQIGAGFYNTAFEESATYAVSGYRFPTDAFGNVAGDSGYGMSTRETALLWANDAGDVLHIGGSYSFNGPGSGTLDLRSTPEVGFTQLNLPTVFPIPFFVDTGVQPTANYQMLGGELAAGINSFVFQSEFIYGMLSRDAGSFLNLPAGYAQVSYVLTRERRTYNRTAAAFTRVIPASPFGKGGSGAWEVAGRYSFLDLNDDDVFGGRIQDLTFGVNWYLNRFTRWEFNYIHPILDRPVGNETHADVFGTRVQLDF
jgi:phosphate-selective porin OprO and OprP